MRTLHIAFLLLAIGLGRDHVQAQQQQFTFLEVESPFDRAQLKEVMVAVNDIDPGAQVFHSDDMMILQVKVSPGIPEEVLRNTISSTGLRLRPGTPDLQARYGTAPNVPVYVPTGDPAADHARYVQAVKQWNEQHPEERMPEPIPFTNE